MDLISTFARLDFTNIPKKNSAFILFLKKKKILKYRFNKNSYNELKTQGYITSTLYLFPWLFWIIGFIIIVILVSIFFLYMLHMELNFKTDCMPEKCQLRVCDLAFGSYHWLFPRLACLFLKKSINCDINYPISQVGIGRQTQTCIFYA